MSNVLNFPAQTTAQDYRATLAEYPTSVSQYLKSLIPGMRNRGMRPDEIASHIEKLANNQMQKALA